ncbi:hypothetical protein [Tabrizicola sp. BL-A-41-H6]|uniref:hypothetical protein n=1 Tax=Tabrizicola sp. BL-A-41-H6 TaxID=3421107 RepID=UPI003D678EB6
MNIEATRMTIGFGPGAVPSVPAYAEGVTSVAFSDLVHGTVDFANCALVITPLFGPGFDAIELLEQLAETPFCGSVRVEAPKLPNKRLVLRELRSVADRSGITVELVELY